MPHETPLEKLKIGNVYKHKLLGDKVIIIGFSPIIIPIPDESPNFRQDDFIDLANGDWILQVDTNQK